MALWTQLGELLFLLLLATMIYSAVAYSRARGGIWPQVFGWSALVAFVTQSVTMAGSAYQSAMPGQATPDVPVSYETWDLIGAIASLLLGLALLVCGIAFVYLGWLEGGGSRRSPRSRRR